jgi:hypothetical protein
MEYQHGQLDQHRHHMAERRNQHAVLSNTSAASTITLSSGLTPSSVIIGNNTNYTFTGNGLSATSCTA